VRGCDIDDENRLVLISGSLPQVLRGFDMITDLIFPSMASSVPNILNPQMIIGNTPPVHAEVRGVHIAGTQQGREGCWI